MREEAKANDEANGMKTLLEVVDHHVQLQLAHGADQLLAGALGVSGGGGRDGRGDLNGVVVVVQDLELTQQQGHVGRLLRLHGDLHDGIALVMIGHSLAATAKRREERDGHCGVSLSVPLFMMQPSSPSTPKMLPGGTASTATMSRPIRRKLRVRRSDDEDGWMGVVTGTGSAAEAL